MNRWHRTCPPPRRPGTSGLLDAAHLAEIITFFDEIPAETPLDVQETSEKFLADKATQLRPDQLKKVAKKLAQTINPDGKFSEQDRIRKSGFHWEAQRADGMSKGVLWATPQLRAHLDAFFAKYAGYGMSMPDQTRRPATGQPGTSPTRRSATGASPAADAAATATSRRRRRSARHEADGDRPAVTNPHDRPTPTTPRRRRRRRTQPTPPRCRRCHPPSPAPTPAVTDFRTPSQRRHDALNHWARSILGNPALGTHHGLPVTVVATTTLAELASRRRVRTDRHRNAHPEQRPDHHGRPAHTATCRSSPATPTAAPSTSTAPGAAPTATNGSHCSAATAAAPAPTATAPPKTPKPTTAPTSPPTAKPMSTS